MKSIKALVLTMSVALVAGGSAFAAGTQHTGTGTGTGAGATGSDQHVGGAQQHGTTTQGGSPGLTHQEATGASQPGVIGDREDTTGASGMQDRRSRADRRNGQAVGRDNHQGTGVTGAARQGDMDQQMAKIKNTSIEFEEGSATLTDAHREKLRNIVREARARGDLDQVTIAAWSDKPHPREEGQNLPQADRDLADRRAENISNFLSENLDVDGVETFNMAEGANWLARTFNTREAELRSLFGREGAENPVTEPEFRVIKREGGASKAVIVIEQEMDRRAGANDEGTADL